MKKKYFESTFGNLVRGHIEVSKQSKFDYIKAVNGLKVQILLECYLSADVGHVIEKVQSPVWF